MNLLQHLYDNLGPNAPYCFALHPETGAFVRCETRDEAREYHQDGWKLLAAGSKPRREQAA